MIALIAAGLLAVGLAACSSSPKSSSTQAGMTIRNFTFSPSPVKAGSAVSVHNNDAVSHTVTADDGAFNLTVKGGSSAMRYQRVRGYRSREAYPCKDRWFVTLHSPRSPS